VEVKADEAGRDTRIGDPGVLDDAPDDARETVMLGGYL
jgi:hypothetical protein